MKITKYPSAAKRLSNTPLLLVTLIIGALILTACATPTARPAKVVLVTLDGVRWQEIFSGIDKTLAEDKRFSHSPDWLLDTYWHQQHNTRRQLLFPFLWSTVAQQGVMLGNRNQHSYMEVTNPWWFSYPGYNEILTGRSDPAIDSNDKQLNKNRTVLEVLNERSDFNNKVMAFGSWDVFPYIINSERSKVPVNAGFSLLKKTSSEKQRWLNHSAGQAPQLWSSVRLDYLTQGYAMEALKIDQPRVLYIALGETDDFAHDGNYSRYIDAARRSDTMLAELWHWLQSDDFYRGRTNLIITTDHGRGNSADTWQHHLSPLAAKTMGLQDTAPEGVPGSDEIWFAAIGPAFEAKGLVAGRWHQSQIAATLLASLGLSSQQLMPTAGPAITEILRDNTLIGKE